eukprot:comp26111_c0_seq1/m.47075 comp26111_c0_seq1/g.47075  ORF comp26111_c0_seq1/g.47075 comp26111_c0_seq1/m.47075 type:complete len:275 (-) comp26111_c0_seq1:436-1260(-)
MPPVRTNSRLVSTVHKCCASNTATTNDCYQPYFMSLYIHAYALDFMCPTMAKDRDWLARLPFMKATSVRTNSTPTQNMVRMLRRLSLVKGRSSRARVVCVSNNEPDVNAVEQVDGFLFDVHDADSDCDARALGRGASMKAVLAESRAGTVERKHETIRRLSSVGNGADASFAAQKKLCNSLESEKSNVDSFSVAKRVTFANYVEVQGEGEVVIVLLSEMDSLQQGRSSLQESSGQGYSRQQNERMFAEAAQQHPELQEVFDMFDSYTGPTIQGR